MFFLWWINFFNLIKKRDCKQSTWVTFMIKKMKKISIIAWHEKKRQLALWEGLHSFSFTLPSSFILNLFLSLLSFDRKGKIQSRHLHHLLLQLWSGKSLKFDAPNKFSDDFGGHSLFGGRKLLFYISQFNFPILKRW